MTTEVEDIRYQIAVSERAVKNLTSNRREQSNIIRKYGHSIAEREWTLEFGPDWLSDTGRESMARSVEVMRKVQSHAVAKVAELDKYIAQHEASLLMNRRMLARRTRPSLRERINECLWPVHIILAAYRNTRPSQS